MRRQGARDRTSDGEEMNQSHKSHYSLETKADARSGMFLSVKTRIERLLVWSRDHYLSPFSANNRNPINGDAPNMKLDCEQARKIIKELAQKRPGNFEDLYFSKPYTLSCSDQPVCTGFTVALTNRVRGWGQLKVGTSHNLGVG